MDHEEDTVLILTPMKNVSNHLNEYFKLLESFDYPTSLISIGILEGGSTDDTYPQLVSRLEKVKSKYRRVVLINKDFEDRSLNLTVKNRHDWDKQVIGTS